MESESMSEKELAQTLVDHYLSLLRIKNDGVESKVLNTEINNTRVRLELLGVNVDSLM